MVPTARPFPPSAARRADVRYPDRVPSSFRARCVLLFALLSVVYHSNLRPIVSSDSLPSSLIPFSVWLDGSVTLDRFAPFLQQQGWYADLVMLRSGSHWHSTYPIAGPLLVTPLYFPAVFLPKLPPETLVVIARIAEKFVATALAAAAAIALLLLLRRLTTDRAAWWLTLIFALGTANWSICSQALWQHTFGQLAIIGFVYAVDRMPATPWAAGVCAASAIAIRPTNVVLAVALALVLWLIRARPAEWVRAFAPILIAGAATAAYNFTVFHRISGGYDALQPGRFWTGLPAILLSPGRGLFIYTPVAAFAFAAFAARARAIRDKHRPLVAASVTIAVLHIAVIACWRMWWGGYTWGPRLLTEILAPVMVLIAVGLPAITAGRLKRAFVAAAIYGCFIQALGAYCYPKGHWDNAPIPIDSRPARVWDWRDNPIVRTARAGFAWEPYSIAVTAVRDGLPAASRRMRAMGFRPY
jgi:hypothetical protein